MLSDDEFEEASENDHIRPGEDSSVRSQTGQAGAGSKTWASARDSPSVSTPPEKPCESPPVITSCGLQVMMTPAEGESDAPPVLCSPDATAKVARESPHIFQTPGCSSDGDVVVTVSVSPVAGS